MKHLAIVLLVFGIVTKGPAATVLRVAHSGDADFKSIQAAIATAGPGTVVEVAAGTWREDITISRPITLKGAGWNRTIVELPGNTESTVEAMWDRIIRGLEAMTPEERKQKARSLMKLPVNQPLRIADAKGVTVSNIGFHWAGPRSINPHVIQQLAQITNSTARLEGVAIVGSVEDGLLTHGNSDVTLTNCLIAGNWGRGIQARSGRIRVVGCDLRHNYRSHIAIFHGMQSARVDSSRLFGSAFFGLRPGGTNTVISGNAVFDNARTAFYLGSTSLVISNNLILRNEYGGASAWGGNRDHFIDNTFVNNGRYGVISIGSAKPVLTRNIFFGHDTAIQSGVSAAKPIDRQKPGEFDLRENLFSNNRTNWMRLIRPPNANVRVPQIVNLKSHAGTKHFDPGFRDPGSRDYSLRGDSQARAAGFGAADPISLESPFELTESEKAMIPAGDSWAFNLWRKPPDPDLRSVRDRLYAALRGEKPAAKRSAITYAQAFEDLYLHLGKHYPNFRLKGIDWAAVGRELGPRVAGVTNDVQFGHLCQELVARLEDSHAYVGKGSINPPAPPLARWDAGFACLLDKHGDAVIYHIASLSSAAEHGLLVGMTIVSINGKPVAEAIADTKKQVKRYLGYSSEQYLDYHAARWFARQPIRNFPLKVIAADFQGNRKLYNLKASSDYRYLPRLPVPNPGINENANVSWTMLPGDIGLIYVRRIKGDLIPKLDAAITDLSTARGLIIDVRGNSGGGFDSRLSHVNFIPDMRVQPERPRYLGPIAVLIDSRCISAGEGWASWFLAQKRAMFFGTATAGASARKDTYALKNGLFKVTFPVKPYKGFLDRIIERRGLEPHVEVRPGAADIQKKRDSVLEAAREKLLQVR